MTLRTHAESFVETLEDARFYEHQSRKAWLRLQLKARIRQFVEEFRTDFDGSPRVSDWSRKCGPRHDRP